MIVMKFGGTSVGTADAIKRLADIVKSRVKRSPVVVVSAFSKATDILQEAANLSAAGEIQQARKKISELKKRHLETASEVISDKKLFEKASEKIEELFSEISDLIKGVNLLSEISDRILARTVSYGELLSTSVIHPALVSAGIKTELADARDFITTDGSPVRGEPCIEEIKTKAPEILGKIISTGSAVLTQGFIARSRNGNPSTLGRGGSDFTASLIGLAMHADEIEIWTDVDGMLTADPRKVPDAKLVTAISFEEAAELAYFGAKVLHPSTIQPALEKNIPVRVLNSMNPDGKGTLIVPDSKTNKGGIKSISCKENIRVVNIFSTKMLNSYGFLKRIFEIFDHNQTSVDVITTSEVNVSLTMDNEEHIDDIIKELSEFSRVRIEEDQALICVVGKDLRYTKGVAKRVFQALGDFNITMISQGASLINLSFVVDKNDAEKVMQNLHNEFFGNQ